MAALRTGRFQRVLMDDDGNPCGERHEFLPHTLVLLNDTHPHKGVLSLEILLPSVARVIELLTREEVSAPFLGAVSDLDRHETRSPSADSLGLYSFFVPNREERIAGELDISVEVISHILRDKLDSSALAKRFLVETGLYATEAEQLGIWKMIKQSVNLHLGMDPVDRFREFHFDNPDGYFLQYEELREEMGTVDTDQVGDELYEDVMNQGMIDAQLRYLKGKCPPMHIQPVLNHALSLLEQDYQALEASVYCEDAGVLSAIDEYEKNANRALEHFMSAKRHRKRDALSEVRGHLLSALELRAKSAYLKVLYTILSRFIEAVGTGEMKSWAETERHAQDMTQALKSMKEELFWSYDLIRNGHSPYRGNSSPLRSSRPRKVAVPDDVAQQLLKGTYNVIRGLYGQPFEVIRSEILSYLQRRMRVLLQSDGQPLTSRLLVKHDFRDALRSSLPFLTVDTTVHTHRRAVFCFSPLEDSREKLGKAIADTGIHVDRIISGVLRGADDELDLMTYNRGVPLDSVRSLRECSRQYHNDDESDEGHLDPLYGMLPDPLNSNRDGKIYLLMGVLTGCVGQTGDGYSYLDLEGVQHNVSDISFFSEYGNAVEVTGRFIVNLKRNGFEPVMEKLDQAKSMKEFEYTAPGLLSSLEHYASIYERGIS